MSGGPFRVESRLPSLAVTILFLARHFVKECASQSLAEVVSLLELEPLPEGGYYRESYRDLGVLKQECLPTSFRGSRNFSNEILFALSSANISTLHRLSSAEAWHFYLGRPLLISEIRPDGELRQTLLGNDLLAGQIPQYVVPPGVWFGASMGEPVGTGSVAEFQQASDYVLVGNSVAPGLEDPDYELGNRTELLQLYPQHSSTIDLLLPED